MLNAQANQAMLQKIARLEGEIKETESSIDPLKPHTVKKVVEYARIGSMGAIGAFLGFSAATVLTGGGLLAVAGVAGGSGLVTGLLGYLTGDTDLLKRRKNGIVKINSMSSELLKNKLNLLESASPGSVIDFVFNREPTIEIEEQELPQAQQQTKTKIAKNTKKVVSDKSIEPITLDTDLKSKLMAALRLQDKKPLKIKIRKIDISKAELQPQYLEDLLTAGLGRFDTEHLILQSDNHSEESIKILKTHIVDKKTAFQNLKTLDMSKNKINGACLDDVAEIVKHLKLQNLILSDNVELGGKQERDHFIEDSEKPLQDFFKSKPRMSNLKKVSLNNTGIVESQAVQLGAFVKKSIQLQELDVSENHKLSYTAFVESINDNGIAENISLQALTTDHDQYLEADVILEARDTAFKEFKEGKTQQTAWSLHLINYVLTNGKLPIDAKKYLATKQFNEDKIKKIVGIITKAREDYLGVKKGTKAPVSERERYSYYAKDLHELYKLVRDKKIVKGLDEELIKNINVSQVKNKKTSPVAKVNPATPRTKVSPAASSPKVRRATPKKKVSPVAPKTKASPSRHSPRFVASPKNESISQVKESVGKRPAASNAVVQSNQPEAFAPLYQSARNAGLRAQIEQSIGKAPSQNAKVGAANRFRI